MAEPGPISKCHMRPVLMVPVLVPACPYAVSEAMIISQSRASDLMSWAIPRCYQTSLDHADRTTTPSSPDQLYPATWWWEKPVSPHDSDSGVVFPWCGNSQPMPLLPLWITLLVSRSWRRTLEIPPCDIPVLLDIALWDSPRPDNWKWVQEFLVGYSLPWLPLCCKIAIYAHRQQTAEFIRYKCGTLSFGAARIRTPQEGIDRGKTESVMVCEILYGGGGGGILKCRGALRWN